MISNAPHQAIYRRWRAQTFGQIVGQQPVVETLRNAVRSGRTAHAYLFVGPRGTGKTSMARILAKALNCVDMRDGEPCDRCEPCTAIREGRALDVSEMDAASNNRVDDIRDLMPRIYTAPSDLRRKVFIIDEVQRIREGWDVLLKTLEEPPEHAVFIFCTTDSSQIRPAVISRVQRFDFRRLTVAEIGGKLRTILEADGRQAEPEAVELIARLAAGGMRDAESMLDQLLSSAAEVLTVARVRDVLGLVESETVESFVLALVDGDALAGIAALDSMEERGRDLRAFLDQAIDRLREALGDALARRSPDRLAAAGPARLATALRTLAAIDPTHLGPGGLRLQLELPLLSPSLSPQPVAATSAAVAPSASPATRSAPVRPASGTAADPGTPLPQADARAQARPAAQPEPRRTPAKAPSPAIEAPPDDPRVPEAKPADAKAASAKPDDARARGTTPAAPAASGAARAGLAQLLERWPEIVAAVSQHPPSKPLIEACRPISFEGSVVTLGFPEAQTFLQGVAERRRPILEEKVSRVLGVTVSVRCVAANVEVAPLDADPDAARLLSEFRRIYGDDVVDVGEVG